MTLEKKLELAKKLTIEELEELAKEGRTESIKSTLEKLARKGKEPATSTEPTKEPTKEPVKEPTKEPVKGTISTLQDLKRVLIDRDFDNCTDIEDAYDIPFIKDFIVYYNFNVVGNEKASLSFNPENCTFEIKGTQDLIKANAFRTPTLKFVKKIPLKNLMYRFDIGSFVTQWNLQYEKNVNKSNKSVDLDALLKDKVLLDTLELELAQINANNIDEQNDGKIAIIEEKINDLNKEKTDLKKSVREREAQASIIRRKNLIDSLKVQINYDKIKY